MIHQFKRNGYNIILDVNSGSVHNADEVAYEIIALYEIHSREEIIRIILERFGDRPDVTEAEIREVFDDLETLRERNQLFTEDPYASLAAEFKKRQSVVKAVCLHIAHDCNLTCRYCFAEEGEYHGKRSLMSYETGKQALDFLIANSGTRRNLEVDFFGGEPLLNFEVVKQLVAYGRSQEEAGHKQFRFTLTTNGVLLNDDVIDFCNREMSNVVLSLDGRKEVNDRMRRNRGGEGSYDRILPRFQKLVQSREQKDYYMRGTYTRYNTDFAKDVLHMADLGFKELSIEPVVADPKEDYALREEELPELLAQYDDLAEEMIRREREGKGFRFYHYTLDLTGGPCVVKRISGCGVGMEYLAVTPEGDLYPCHQFVGEEAYLLGNVWEGIVKEDAREEFRTCHIYSHPECRECFARMYCSGGCAANAYHTTGSIHGVYGFGCELHRRRIENALMIQIAGMEMLDK